MVEPELAGDEVKRLGPKGQHRAIVLALKLAEITPDADEWFRESGPEHIGEHLPDLERFVRDRG